MEDVERTSWGWRPSPGSIYPLLEELQTEGLIRRREDGRYELTRQGKENPVWPWSFFMQGTSSLEGVVAELKSFVAYLEDLSQSDPKRLSEHMATLGELTSRLERIVKVSDRP